ncbi:hypothetical protein EWM64_g6437 [Hericium alpestre]|uniref:Tyr recombinase domain-containing protein n=1 Tax=Hericium alpestre TaxID=135208 RepID=A0A4Y9ZU43_9AGAM|nr:hypothetical protein EWM64_g6437 [Hericium alpestre]
MLSTPSIDAGGDGQMLKLLKLSRQPMCEPWTHKHLVREHAIMLGSAIDPSLHLTYTSHLQSYLTFCKIHDFGIEPTIDNLSFYVVFMCHHIQPRSVNQYLSGICNQLEHLYPSMHANRSSPLVSRTLAGCLKCLSSSTKHKDPLSAEQLSQLVHACTEPNHDDLLFVAIMLCTFFGLHQLGEVTQPDRAQSCNSRKIINRTSVEIGDDHLQYTLPTHKANRFFEGNTVRIARRPEDFDPHLAFTRYLCSRDARFPWSPQLWLTTAGVVPTRSWYLDRLHLHFGGNIGGHSLRSGGATFFAAEGWPDDRIQALGRWSSDAFRIYIQKNPVILQALLHARTTSA